MSCSIRRFAGLGAAIGLVCLAFPLSALAQNRSIPGTEWIVHLPDIDETLAPTPLNLAGRARVRLVQTIPDQKLDMSINKAVMFNSVPFEKATPYQTVAPEEMTFSITRTAISGSAVATRSIRLEPNQSYTAISLLDADGKPALQIVPDKRIVPPARGASVRILNAAAEAGQVDIYTRGGSSPLFNGVDSGDTTKYRPLPAGASTLEVSSSKAEKSRVKLPSFNLEAGKAYTLVLAGMSGKSSQVVATLVEDPS